jgi:hypothetical protein
MTKTFTFSTPSIIPGISAITKDLKFLYSTIPKLGVKCSKSIIAIFGFAAETALKV